MNAFNAVFFVILALLQVADIWLTMLVINNGGKEMNPITQFLIKQFKLLPGLVIAKAVMLAIVGFVVVKSGFNPVTIGLLISLVALYCWVVVHNYTQYQEGKK